MLFFAAIMVAIAAVYAEEECGHPSIPHTRVIGGKTAKRGAWPWQILMKIGARAGCGGTLIHPQWVLTAAHCVYMIEKYPFVFTITVGEYDRAVKEGSEVEVRVAKVVRYQGYDPPHLNNDIALMKLNKPVTLGKYVKTACLPTKAMEPGSKCYITGWGKMHHPGKMVRYLQQALLPVVSNEACYKKNHKVIPVPITSAMVCGGDGGETVKSGCHGDSGGPYVCEVNGKWEVHGSVSHGSKSCNSTESYTVFSRTFHFVDWIKEKIIEN